MTSEVKPRLLELEGNSLAPMRLRRPSRSALCPQCLGILGQKEPVLGQPPNRPVPQRPVDRIRRIETGEFLS